MYNIGEYISFGNNGVCEIIGTEALEMARDIADNRQCYILRPLHDQSCTIITPVDNPKVIMRSLISKEETKKLLEDIPEIETLPEQSARQQEIAYQKALHSCNCREWVRLIKTLTYRISIRKQKGKKVTATDDRYYKAASEKLIEEFSVVLGIDKGETEELLTNAFSL